MALVVGPPFVPALSFTAGLQLVAVLAGCLPVRGVEACAAFGVGVDVVGVGGVACASGVAEAAGVVVAGEDGVSPLGV